METTMIIPNLEGALVKGYLKIAEAAKQLSAPERTVNYWIRRGDFPNAIKMNPMTAKGSPWLIPQGDIDAFIERRNDSARFDKSKD